MTRSPPHLPSVRRMQNEPRMILKTELDTEHIEVNLKCAEKSFRKPLQNKYSSLHSFRTL